MPSAKRTAGRKCKQKTDLYLLWGQEEPAPVSDMQVKQRGVAGKKQGVFLLRQHCHYTCLSLLLHLSGQMSSSKGLQGSFQRFMICSGMKLGQSLQVSCTRKKEKGLMERAEESSGV